MHRKFDWLGFGTREGVVVALTIFLLIENKHDRIDAIVSISLFIFLTALNYLQTRHINRSSQKSDRKPLTF